MRTPAAAIAAAFAGGILLARELHVASGVLGISFLGIFSLLICLATVCFARQTSGCRDFFAAP
jgi:hypothetical protein